MSSRLAAAILALAFAAACGKGGSSAPAEAPLPSIVAAIPSAPTPADEGAPGTWIPLAGLAPAARGFLVEPPGDTPAPGILLVHATWGINGDVRAFARRLATHGYCVVAPDIFDGLEATTRLSVKELLAGTTSERATAVLRGGIAALRAVPRTKGRPLAVVALGQGGAWAPLVAADEGIAALAFDSWRFGAAEWEGLGRGGRPVLLIAGSENALFPPTMLEQLRRHADDGKVPFEVAVIPNAGTDLFDPSAPGHSSALEPQAFDDLVKFLKARLG